MQSAPMELTVENRPASLRTVHQATSALVGPIMWISTVVVVLAAWVNTQIQRRTLVRIAGLDMSALKKPRSLTPVPSRVTTATFVHLDSIVR